MKYVPLFCLLLSFLLGNTQVVGQGTATVSAVKELFNKPEKIVWIKHYAGRMDDLNDVAVTLAYDGKHCKGQIRHLKSREVYGLAGYIKNKKIRLQEVNQEEQISGFIEGDIEGDTIVGNWSKYDNSVGKSMVLQESKKPLSIPTNCANNKWVRTFSGTIDRKDVGLMLQLESDNEIKGIVYFYKSDKTYDVIGEVEGNGKVVLKIYNSNAFEQGSIVGYINNKGIIDAGYTGEDGKQQICSFWEQDQLHVACIEYSDYSGSYDITYPKSKNAAFNKWMKGVSDEWLTACRNQIKKVNDENKVMAPDSRSSVQAFAWCDLDYVSTQVISGTLLLNSNWEKQTELVAFSFDLTNSKKIELEDIFDKDFDYQQMVWDYVSEDIKKHKYYEDYNFRKWLAAESFENFAIRQDGINFSTSYSPIYGQQKVTVPYYLLTPHIKKKSPVWILVPEELSRM